MSPEQLAGDTVDRRADVYALGVMGYQMLTGKVPFAHGSPMEILARRLSEAPEPVTRARPDAPTALASVVMKCLAIQPEDRFATAGEVVRALETGRPVSSVSRGAVAQFAAARTTRLTTSPRRRGGDTYLRGRAIAR